MTARLRGDGAGEVFIQVQVMRTGDVACGIGAATVFGIGQAEAAIDDDPVRVVQMGGQFCGGNEGGGVHQV